MWLLQRGLAARVRLGAKDYTPEITKVKSHDTIHNNIIINNTSNSNTISDDNDNINDNNNCYYCSSTCQARRKARA